MKIGYVMFVLIMDDILDEDHHCDICHGYMSEFLKMDE